MKRLLYILFAVMAVLCVGCSRDDARKSILKVYNWADYIDESRKFDDCVYLRNYFWSAEPEKMDAQVRLKHLYETMIKAFDLTVEGLVAKKSLISAESIEARNSLILKL